MTSTRKGAGLALLTLGLGVWRAWGQIEGCASLITSITDGATLELGSDITCSEEISIAQDEELSIDGAGFTLYISNDLLYEEEGTNAVIYNKGTLTLTDLTVTVEDDSADNKFRAIYNEGDLTVNLCTFSGLNLWADPLDDGGVIYSESTGGTVSIESSIFTSNGCGLKGGAIYAAADEQLTITDCEFSDNEAGTTGEENASGGDVYAADEVTLVVQSSNFRGSATEYGGAAIHCCGATITSSRFIDAESGSAGNEHYGGAILVGLPGVGCTQELEMTNSTFNSCSVQETSGAGGSLAIFDTNATLDDITIDYSQGSAVLFQSSDADGSHAIMMTSMEFQYNTNPSAEYASNSLEQGSAFVLQNTAAENESVMMGSFDTVYCQSNDPYECEMVFDLAGVTYTGDIKCQICNIDRERLWVGLDEDSIADGGSGDTEDSDGSGDTEDGDGSGDTEDSSSSGSSDSDEYIIIGLSLALGLTLVVIGALAVWKIMAHMNTRSVD